MNIDKILVEYTIPIVSSDDKRKVEKMFSGCLLNFRSLNFVLTVAHGLKNKKSKPAIIMHNIYGLEHLPNWYIFNPIRLKQFRTRFHTKIVKLIFEINRKLRKGISDDELMSKIIKYVGGIDYMSSAVFLPYLPVHSLPIDSKYFGIPKNIFQERNLAIPNTNANYNFYGLVNYRIENGNYLCDEKYVHNIKYVKTKGYNHIFKLQSKEINLRGCSGAPIIDNEGNLVSILIKRNKIFRKYLYGINLELSKIALHQEANAIKGEEVYE